MVSQRCFAMAKWFNINGIQKSHFKFIWIRFRLLN